MKRICFLVDNILAATGVENMTVALANQLSRLNYDVTIAVLFSSTKSSYSVDEKVHLIALNSKFSEKKKSIKVLRTYLLNNKTDYLISVCAHLALIAIPSSRFLSVKNVVWEHFNYHQANMAGKLIRYFSILCGYKFVTLTNEDKKNYSSILYKKIVPIPNFISNFPKNYQIKTDKEDSNYVLAIGRFNSLKGFDLLLQVWSLVVKQLPHYKLKIVGEREGEKEYALELKKLALKLNIQDFVDFLPATKDIDDYYCNADCFVLSSRYEGFSMCLLEAKSFGIPSVCFNCKYGPSDLIRDGIDGILVELSNVEKMAESIIYLLKNRSVRLQMAINTQQDFLDRFNTEKIIGMWQTILK